MKVTGLNNGFLNNTYLSSDGNKINNQPIPRTNKSLEGKGVNDLSTKLENQISLLNNKERNFFKKMFPENSRQIENHILFTRNAKVLNAAQSKGSLLDAKVQ